MVGKSSDISVNLSPPPPPPAISVYSSVRSSPLDMFVLHFILCLFVELSKHGRYYLRGTVEITKEATTRRFLETTQCFSLYTTLQIESRNNTVLVILGS